MTTAVLIADLTALGIELQANGDRLRYAPRSAVTPDLVKRMTAHKGELLATLAGIPYWPEVTPEANEEFWTLIDEADRDYLLSPRDLPGPCEWCGGRLIYSPACGALRDTWVPIIPFGKHRGRRANEVPADYIAWILKRDAGDDGFRDELRRWREIDHTESLKTNARGDP